MQQSPHPGLPPTAYPGYLQGSPAYSIPGYPPAGGGYGYPPVTGAMPALVTGPMPLLPNPVQTEGKRSTPLRDIFIGVASAAVVLGAFFVVKTLAFDDDQDSVATTRTIATIRISMTPGLAADMFIDDTRIAVVTNNQDVPVTAGNRRVVLVGPNGATCDKQVLFEPGRTVTLKCEMPKPGSATSGSGAGTRVDPPAPVPPTS